MADPATIGLAIRGGIGLFNAARSFFGNRNSLTIADINRQVDLHANRALAETAAATRRRLAGTGISGGTSVDAAIAQAQTKVRSIFEEQRTQLINQFKQAQDRKDQISFDQIGRNLAELGNFASSVGSFINDTNANNLLQGQLNDLSSIRSNNPVRDFPRLHSAATVGNPAAPNLGIPNRGVSGFDTSNAGLLGTRLPSSQQVNTRGLFANLSNF